MNTTWQAAEAAKVGGPANNETDSANDAYQDQGGDNNYGYGNPNQTPEGPSGGFVTDGSEPGAGWDGFGGPATPANETESANDAWQAQRGDNNFGYGNPNGAAEQNINNWGMNGWGGDKDTSPAVGSGLGDTETAPTNFGSLNETLFDSGTAYDSSANTAADFNGLEGYSNNASGGYDDTSNNYGYGNTDAGAYSNNDYSYGGYGNEMESANQAYNGYGSDNYGYGNTDSGAYSNNDYGYSDNYGYGNTDASAYTDYSSSDNYGYGSSDYGSYNSYDYASYDTGSSSYDSYSSSYDNYDYGSPVVLDLSGNGINLSDLASSHMYFDMAGDGYQHRTAWAGVGNGVLVLDTAGNGQITQRNQIVFTDWDPTAETDMQALANVFDTNGNGKLDAGDAQFASFKLMVTNANGTTSLQTLAQAGVASIDLKANSSVTMMADGSKIEGETTFTRTNGTTGTAATVSLEYETQGAVLRQTTVTNANGSTTITATTLNSDGSLAGSVTTNTTSNGLTRTISFDRDGDAVIDRVQTITKATNATTGAITETVTNRDNANVLIDKTTTVTSGDKKTVTISRDVDGDTKNDQTEVRQKNVNGTYSITISDLNIDGTVKAKSTSTLSANGLTRTVASDLDGNTTTDLTQTDSTTVAGDGSRTQIVSTTNNNGSLRAKITTVTSADGRTQTVTEDLDGNTTTDATRVSSIAVAGDGSSTSTQAVSNGNGSLRDKTVTSVSASGLVTTTQMDIDGNGTFDATTSDATVVNANGSRTQTIITTSANGTLVSKSTNLKGADGQSRTIQIDDNGDTFLDSTRVVSVNAALASVDTVTLLNADGTAKGKTVTTTSADGMTVTTEADLSGDNVFDLKKTTTVVKTSTNATTTDSVFNGNGTLREKTIATTTSNGLSTTITRDVDGNGTTDFTTTDVTVVAADTSRTQTVTTTSANATLKSKATTVISADRRTTTITVDNDGDTKTDSTISTVENLNGSIVETASEFSPNAVLKNKVVTTTSANGLTRTVQIDADGNNVFEQTRNSVTVLNTDGSRTTTATTANANAIVTGRAVTTVSATGLSTTVQTDADNNGTFERTATSVTVLNTDGSRATTQSVRAANNALLASTIATIADDGLSSTVQRDLNGDGVIDVVLSDATVLNADGSRTSTITETRGGTLQSKTISTTAVNGSLSVTTDSDGDLQTDRARTVVELANGNVVDTVSDFNANGSLVDRTITTTSATGLSSSAEYDADGDGDIDRTITDVTVLNANGSSTATTTVKLGTTVTDKAVVTTSADGLTTTTQLDLDGNGTFDSTTTDVTALNVNGSRTETVTETHGNGALKAKSVTDISADRRTVTVTLDSDGDTKTDSTVSTVEQLNGSIVETVSAFNPNGTLKSKIVTTTSANGLTRTVQYDTDGNGVFEETVTSTTVLNNDGSRTETMSSAGSDGYANHIMVTTTSANGLTTTVQDDTTGSAAFERTVSSVTAHNADGSRTTTVSDRSSNNTLTGKTITTISGNGLSTTVQKDLNGDGAVDVVLSDITVLNANGSRTETVSTTQGGTLRSKVTTTTAVNGSQTRLIDNDGDNLTDRSESFVELVNGNIVDTISDFNTNGTLRDKTFKTTSANGLFKTVEHDADGDGDIDRAVADVTVLNADGSRTETTTISKGTTLTDRAVLTTSANGWSSTRQLDTDGNGTYDTTTSRVAVLNTDGSRVETMTETNANGSLRSKTTTSISATGQSRTVDVDLDGDTKVDVRETMVEQLNGSIITTTSQLNIAGATIGKVTKTTADDGLSWTKQFDDNNDGVVDQTTSLSVVFNADGSKTETFDDWNGVLHTTADGYATSAHVVTTTSADGFTVTRAVTGWNEYLPIDHNATTTTTINADGSRNTFTEVKSGTVVWSTRNINVSANGLSATTIIDTNGDGYGEHSNAIVTAVDGSRTETYQAWNYGGSAADYTYVSTAADGKTRWLYGDRDSDGNYDHYETSAINADDTSTVWKWETDAAGNVINEVITKTAANGLGETVEIDGNGDGVIDFKHTATTVYNADGSATETSALTGTTGALAEKTITTRGANSLSVTTTTDADGDGDVDRTQSDLTTLAADGTSTRQIETLYSSGTLKAKTTIVTSANGQSVATNWDIDGNGQTDMSNTTARAASGVETSTTFNYGATGNLTSKVIATISADERIIRVQRDSDGDGDIDLAEVTLKTNDGNGSYTWTQEDANGTTVVESNHIIDENGVDTINLWLGSTRFTTYIHVDREAQELAKVERIYDTVFDRSMSAAEKHSWAKHFDGNGLNTNGLINELLSSSEFQARFGTLNDASFVTQIYQNANGRGAMLSEYADQLNDLRLGTETRAQMIAALSESAEHYAVGNDHALTSNTLSGGPATAQDHIVDRADAAALVEDVFQTVLDRGANAGDVIAWTDVLTNGSYTVDQFAGQLVSSGEFITSFGSLGNAAFVDRLYTNAVGTIAPNAEYQEWVAALNNGSATRADLAIAIAQSPDLWM